VTRKSKRDPWLELDALCAQKLTLEQMQRVMRPSMSQEAQNATEMVLVTLRVRIEELRSLLGGSSDVSA